MLRTRVLKSLDRMLDFYGFERNGETIAASSKFKERSGWIYPNNHNYLRISRILESLLLLDFGNEAEALFDALIDLYQNFRWDIGESMSIWKRIVGKSAR